MPRIDSKGNIIPDGAPHPPPELPGGAGLWMVLLVVLAAFLAKSIPENNAFDSHIEALTAAQMTMAAHAFKAVLNDSPLGALAGAFGVKNLGGVGESLVEAAAGVLPKMYVRKEYPLWCVYTLGGERHDEVVPNMVAKGAEMGEMTKHLPSGAFQVSSRYLGIGGRFLAWGTQVPLLQPGGGIKGRRGGRGRRSEAESAPAQEEEEEGQEEEEGHVGGDSDTHGCKASAGYTWCEPKKKCVRLWEEPCPGLGGGLGEEGGGDDEGGNWADGI